ncbi:amino acid adenylation domain-containing protein [Okeania sp. KiyG1]|uniref:amino acid adenylation domain-containing protein n=1 Tax=Okeania sp. KiyG1 TaxID=2720165 RepID=UPI0019C8CF6D|nr:non-ribosomal peptide synthetase [Okeania sp. KiyG1]GFZ92165.1 hypothetical protein CYANOKiyG1_02710 [Okeania sp. KiyG1]
MANLSPKQREQVLEKLRQQQLLPTDKESQAIPMISREQTIPLSYAQQRLWFIEKMALSSNAYNMPLTLHLVGKLDYIALEKSLNQIIARHETLRTTFSEIDGTPVQIIKPSFELQLPLKDLSELTPSEATTKLQQLLQEENEQTFNLEVDPPIRARLYQLETTEHILQITLHHIVSDGWSLTVLPKELSGIYTATVEDRPSPLPSLPIQYADFAVWQRNYLQGETFEKQLSYWKQKLQNLSQLQLPTDHPRPAVQTFNGAGIPIYIPAALTSKVRQLTQKQGTTLFMTLLAAFKVLLSSYSGQESVAVGTPIANRNRSEIEGLIGFFVNSLVMHTDLGGFPSFTEVLNRVKQTALEAYSHQDIPFEKLVEELQPERSLSQNPLFQVMFAVQQEEILKPSFNLPNLEVGWYEGAEAEMTVRFDLELHLWPVGEEIKGFCAYNRDLFEAETISRMLSHYQNLLAAAVETPELAVGKLPLMTEVEQEKILIEWNNTITDYPTDKCIHQLFEEQVEKTPDAIAVVFEEQKLTYSQLNRQANQLAHYLQKLGVVPETLVGISVERSVEMVVGLLAILKAGGAYVPLDPNYPQERISYILADSQASVLLTTEKLVNKEEHQASGNPLLNKQQVIYLDADWGKISQENDTDITESGVRPDNQAYVIYTSGSTGKPKGVQINHGSLTNFLKSMSQIPGITDSDKLLAVTTICFDIAALELYLPLIVGAVVIIVTREVASDGRQLLSALENSGATVMQATPATWQMLLSTGWQENSQKSSSTPQKKFKVLCGGEALPEKLANQLLETQAEVWNMYGPTETTIWSSVNKLESSTNSDKNGSSQQVNGKKQSIQSIGKPIYNTQMYILDSNLQPVPVGVTGELYIGGEGLARGYLNQPQLTKEKFIPNPFREQANTLFYKTGDLARYLPDGQIEYLGRIDNQVKIRGYRIETQEIETVLAQNATVKKTVVVAREDNPGDKRLVAYIVPETEIAASSNPELSNTQLNSWQDIFNQQVETRDSNIADSLFNASIWRSSYDNEAIPESQMRVWAENIVYQVLAHKPQKVWEVGCGTGMLLFQIAPHTQSYYGTDISNVSLEYIKKQIEQQPDKYSHVTLAQKQADDMDEIADNSFDVILLSSIVQYFPNIEYLLQVIENSIRVVKPGGMIFLGDIRSFPLMRAFHSSVQLYKASPSLSLPELIQRTERQMQQEKELLLSPELFVAIKEKYPEISHIQIRLQRGSEQNELNKYRYDVLLYKEAKPATVIEVATVKSGRGVSYEDIEAYLQQKQPDSICWSGIVNGRVAEDIRSLELLSAAGEIKNVQQLKQKLQLQTVNSIAPERLYELSSSLGYSLELCWSDRGSPELMDAVFVRSELVTDGIMLTPLTQKNIVVDNWYSYGNNPLASQIAKQVIPELREYLESRLPDYMVPNNYVVLSQLPLTPNGKVDRKALPAPDNASTLSTEYVAPQTETQKALTEIWQEVLGIEKVGIHDNFFSLGGHSLLATQLIFRIRQSLEQDVPLKILFESPTIAQLDRTLLKSSQTEDSLGYESDVPLPLIVLEPEQRYQPFPLTEVQQAYWIGRSSAFELGNVATHGYMEFDCENLNIELLSRAWQQVIEHHDMLRAIILPDGQQQVLKQVHPYQIEVLDLHEQSSETVANKLEAIRHQLSHEILPADQWPLFKITTTRLDEKLYRLHWSFDMLLADAWSLIIIWQQWLQLYQNPETILPKVEVSFRDYIMAEVSLKETPQYRRSQQYWLNRLDTLPPTPELPLVKPLSTLKQPRFISKGNVLSKTDWQKLKQRAKRANLTPSGVLLTAFADFLTCWSKSPKFTINLTLFNRLPLHPQVNQIVGDFTSLTLLEVNNSVALPFQERAQRIQGQLWSDLDHRYVGGVEVQRELHRHRGSYQPMGVIFTSTLALDSMNDGKPDDQSEEFPLLQLGEPVYSVTKTPQVWLDHGVVEQEGALILIWNVVEELFPEGLLDEMFNSYCNWLQQLATSDEAWSQTNLQLLPPAQITQRTEVNQTTVPISEETLHSLFVKQVKQLGEAIAVITPEHTLTYQELYTQAHKIGQKLQHLGATPNTLVAVLMTKGWEQVAAVLGILMSGAAYLPIDPTLPQERQWHLLEQGEVKLALTQAHLTGSLSLPEHIQCLSVGAEEWETIEVNPLDSVPSVSDLAYVIFTSGSTGTPKGVMIDHRGAVNTILDINQRFEIQPNDRILAVSALNFDLSVYDIFGVLAAGGTIVMPSPDGAKDPAHWVELMSKHQVTLWNTVPALMQMLVEYLSQHPDRSSFPLRLALLSGDWIPLNLPEQIKTFWSQAQVMSLGGATEASIWSVYYPITTVDPEWKSIPYGKPLANQRLYILNERMEPCPNWVPGQLYIGGIGIAQGYWRNEEKTNASFIIHPHTGEKLYKTGDLARYLPDGNTEFLGREDFQVKISGYRIELGEIEVSLQKHPAVKETVVTAVGELENKQLVAYIVLHPETTATIDELRDYLQQCLPEYMVPPNYIFLEALPLTPNGKVDRKRLPAPELKFAPTTENYVPPRNSQELQLVKMWEDILGVQPVGVCSNFFDLGGHSLLAVRLMNRIEQELGRSLPLSTLFQSSTVEQLARILHQEQVVSDPSPLVPIQPQGSQLPIFCVHPAGGTVFCYFELAQLLGTEQPFYGLQCLGQVEGEEPLTSVEDMAAVYQKAIREVQPKGPYILMGWSFGGMVALEMANNLLVEGEQVAFLGLIDTYAPSQMPDEENLSENVEVVLELFGGDLSLPWEEIRQLPQEKQVALIWEQARQANLVPPDFDATQLERLLHIMKLNHKAMRSYSPPTYPGMITLLRAEAGSVAISPEVVTVDATLGWKEVAISGVDVYTVPGYHEYMVHQPNVAILADQLASCIEKSLSTYQQNSSQG